MIRHNCKICGKEKPAEGMVRQVFKRKSKIYIYFYKCKKCWTKEYMQKYYRSPKYNN